MPDQQDGPKAAGWAKNRKLNKSQTQIYFLGVVACSDFLRQLYPISRDSSSRSCAMPQEQTTNSVKPAKPAKTFDLSTAAASQIADIGDIKQCTGKSRATIYRWVRLGILPKPRKFGPTCNFWTAGEIRDALAKVMGGAE